MKIILSMLAMHAYCLCLVRCSRDGIANQYIGCYHDEGKQSNWTVGFNQSSNLSISRCLQRCRVLKRTYAMLQNGKDCLCEDSIKTSTSNDLCNVTCSGNSIEYCGGSKMQLQYSVFYAVCPIGRYLADCSGVCHCKNQIPCNLLTGVCPNGCEGNWTNNKCNEESTFIGRYIGCYIDRGSRALPTWTTQPFVDSNPIRFCSRYCATNKATYAGLQAATYCLCGENYGRYGKAEETTCSSNCSGNPRQICGGGWRNSVYSVCAAGKFGKECLDICNCRDGEVCNYLNGSCKSGCKLGWAGDSCSVRDCSSNNGDCSENETCAIVNLGYASVSRCVCPSGYGRDTLWGKCREIPSILNEHHSYFELEAVIGIAVGSAAAIFLIIGLVIICRRKKRKGKQQMQSDVTDERRHSNQMTLEVWETVNGAGTDDVAIHKLNSKYRKLR